LLTVVILLDTVEYMETFKSSITKEKILMLTVGLFVVLSVWWVVIFALGVTDDPVNHIFGFIYGGFSLWGGIWGLVIARKWGGLGSLMGKAIYFLSFGLLAQAFGQYSFWYYNYVLKIAVPYPGIPDLGYFGTIPFYIYAAFLLFKTSGAKFSLNTFISKAQAFLIPLSMVVVAYFLILKQYELDFTDPLGTFLNFGYPLGQAVYISIAILTYLLSRKMLGGIMRFPILLIVLAFAAQFLADYIFIYFHDLYFPASFMDYFYLLAYFLMTLSLIYLKVVADQLRKE